MARTVQEKRMLVLLEKLGIPYKTIHLYGSQIVVATRSRSTAERWVTTLSPKVAKFLKMLESFDYAKKNKGTVLLPTRVKVWRVYFRI